MADAPKPASGGSAWTAIEVIIVIILLIALFSHVFGKPLPTIYDDTAATTPAAPAVKAGCSVAISSPKPLGPVADFAVLSGYAKDCMSPTGAMPALTAVVVDGAGMPLSDIVALAASYSDIENKVPFAAHIALTSKSSTKTGSIIVSANGFTDSGSTARVPVTFTR